MEDWNIVDDHHHNNHVPQNNNYGNDDEDLERALLESMGGADVNMEDDILQRVIEDSRRNKW